MSLPQIDTTELFDVSVRSAIVVVVTGSFGKVVCAALGDELEQEGILATTVNRRPSTEEDCEAIVEATVAAYGGLDILVVASGAKVDGAWLIARAVDRQMIAQGRGGKVVFTSSTRGKFGHPAGYSDYWASKAAGITKALGCEWSKHSITVNAIAPTVFRSPLTAWMFEGNEYAMDAHSGFLSRVPAGRLGEPEDLVGPLLFLCSRASDFHSGHIIYADGGYTGG